MRNLISHFILQCLMDFIFYHNEFCETIIFFLFLLLMNREFNRSSKRQTAWVYVLQFPKRYRATPSPRTSIELSTIYGTNPKRVLWSCLSTKIMFGEYFFLISQQNNNCVIRGRYRVSVGTARFNNQHMGTVLISILRNCN